MKSYEEMITKLATDFVKVHQDDVDRSILTVKITGDKLICFMCEVSPDQLYEDINNEVINLRNN